MIILHFDLQPQFKYMNYFIYTSRQDDVHQRKESQTKGELSLINHVKGEQITVT